MTDDSAQRVSRDAHADVVREPVTDYESKKVMLRAERGDTIEIDGEEYEVTHRTDPYFGPKLKLSGPDGGYMLTAPGPDCHLKLWEQVVDEDNFVNGRRPVGEVQAELEDVKQYDICSTCGEPVKTKEHMRLAYIGACEP